MARLIAKGTKFAMKKKWIRRILLTAVAALLLMVAVDFVAAIIREMVAYHTGSTYVAVFAGVNALLSRKKLVRIGKKLMAMGDEDEKVSSSAPAASRTSFADVAREFAASVNTAPAEETEEFED
jgi:hypothetical protein